jgi:hypothetical protein
MAHSKVLPRGSSRFKKMAESVAGHLLGFQFISFSNLVTFNNFTKLNLLGVFGLNYFKKFH